MSTTRSTTASRGSIRSRARTWAAAALALTAGAAVLAGVGISPPSDAAPLPAGPQNGRIFFTDTALLPPFQANAQGGQIYSVNPDGSDLQQLTHLRRTRTTGAPAVSPDGTTVAFITNRSGDLSLWLMDADGRHERELLSTPHTNYYTPAWSPDGSTILLTSCDTDLGEQDCPLVSVHSDGTGLTTVLANRRINTTATYSPNGQRIQYTSDQKGLRGAIWIMRADGSRSRQITPTALEAGQASWAPDGKSLVVGSNCCQPHSNLYSVEPDGTGLTRLTHVPYGQDGYFPSYSPDGRAIAYFKGSEFDVAQLYVVDADGRHPRQIVGSVSAIQPSWGVAPGTAPARAPAAPAPRAGHATAAVSGSGAPAPLPAAADGTADSTAEGRLAFTDDARGVIETINADGTGLAEVTTPDEGIAIHSTWTADGSQLVVSVLPPDFSHESLYLVDADGSDWHALLEEPDGIYDYDPQVTPDGQWVIFGRFNGPLDRGAIFAVRLDGTGEHAVTHYSGKHTNEGTFFHAISPDGTKLGYQVQNHEGISDQIWVGALDQNARLTGGTPITAVAQEAFPYAYAADGHAVLGSNSNEHLGDGLYAFPDTGGDPVQLEQLAYPRELFEPVQSPSGAALAYIEEGPVVFGPRTLMIANGDGSDPVAIDTGTDLPIHAQWSPAPAPSVTAAAAPATTRSPVLSAQRLAQLRAALPKPVRSTLDR